MSKALPKGLREYEGSLHDLRFTEELIGRLVDLPEQGFVEGALSDLRAAMREVEEAERIAAGKRDKARRIALRAWGRAKSEWTIEQLQAATGYDDE
jgi:hypothetical protein